MMYLNVYWTTYSKMVHIVSGHSWTAQIWTFEHWKLWTKNVQIEQILTFLEFPSQDEQEQKINLSLAQKLTELWPAEKQLTWKSGKTGHSCKIFEIQNFSKRFKWVSTIPYPNNPCKFHQNRTTSCPTPCWVQMELPCCKGRTTPNLT